MGEAVDAAAVVVVAALAGNELAIAAFVHPVLSRSTTPRTHRRSSRWLRVTGRAMPFWYAGAVLLAGAAVWVRPVGAAAWWLALAAAGLLAGTVVFTLVGPLPINNRVAGWDLAALPAGWRDDRRRWDRLHGIRVGVAHRRSGAVGVGRGCSGRPNPRCTRPRRT